VTDAASSSSASQIERFEFGENWRRFAAQLPPERIEVARASLAGMLGRNSLEGLSFLDIGSGSGLFSLAAVVMGAERVHSFDYDPNSVETTARLKQEFAPGANWSVDQDDVLDRNYMDSLGSWDVVYAWGVLHHTGDMWTALENTCARVDLAGKLFISIYNDQGRRSRRWRRIKRLYNELPESLRVPYAILMALPMELRDLIGWTRRLKPHDYVRLWWRPAGYDSRGMSRWHNLVDWVGGYPFEVATPQQVFDFCAGRGLELRKLRTVGGAHGCNEFVFELPADKCRPGP
jgi:2-polyprenyl-3-methyl-5-hydroxy-6-metoxy-1,4-benzoquinol methylase